MSKRRHLNKKIEQTERTVPRLTGRHGLGGGGGLRDKKEGKKKECEVQSEGILDLGKRRHLNKKIEQTEKKVSRLTELTTFRTKNTLIQSMVK